MLLIKVMWTLILFCGNIQHSSSNLVPGCLTWEKQGRNLNLICKLNNDKTSVSIIDPQGNHRGYCNIHSKGLNCHATFTGENVEFEVNMMQIVLSVPLNQHPDDGEWVCHQEKSSYTTTVNIEEGIMASSDVQLYGKMHDYNGQPFTSMICASCREPYGNIAEFQINGRTISQIRYDQSSQTCFQKNEHCNGIQCKCTRNGTEFFSLIEAINGKNYSCVMQFEDRGKGIMFKQTATLVMDGQEWKRSHTETEILNKVATTTNHLLTEMDFVNKETKREDVRNIYVDFLDVWIVCVVLLILVVVVFVITKIGLHVKGNKKIMLSTHSIYKEDNKTPVLPSKSPLHSRKEDMSPIKGCNLASVSVHDSNSDTHELVPLLEDMSPIKDCNLTSVSVHDSNSDTHELVPLLDIPVAVHLYQRRWLLFGISCFKVYHSFRADIMRLFSTKFSVLKEKYNIHNQKYPDYLKSVEVPNNQWQLNYRVINENESRFGTHVEKYDYRISSSVELSKMIIPEIFTNYSSFDDTMSFSTILQHLNMFSLYNKPEDRFISVAKEIFESTWSRWCAPCFTDWDEQNANKSFSLLKEMSKHYLESNRQPMTEHQIELIKEKGLTLSEISTKPEENELTEQIVGYSTELIQFLELHSDEPPFYELRKIKRTINEWKTTFKKALDAFDTDNEPSITNCQSCQNQNKNEKAECWCIECDVRLCQRCKEFHLSMRTLADHNLIDVSMYLELLPVERKCQEHISNNVEYICSMHDQLCCIKCLLKHRNCDDVHPISNIKTKKIELFTIYKKKLDDLCSVLQILSQLSCEVKTPNSGFFEEVYELVRSFCCAKDEISEGYLQLLESEKTDIIQTLDKEFKSNNLEENIKEMAKEVNQESQQFAILKETCSNEILYLFIHSSVSRLDKIETRISSISMNFSKNSKLKNGTDVYKLCMQSMEWLLDSYKKTYAQSPKEKQFYVCVDSQFEEKWVEVCSNANMTKSKISAITTANNNLILVCFIDDNRVFTIDEFGVLNNIIELEYTPCDIAFALDEIKKEPICVTTCDKVNALQFLDVCSQTKKETIHIAETASCLITISENNIVVGSSKKIKILTFTGKEIKTVKLNFLFGNITNMITSNHNFLVLCDDNPNSSTVYCVRTDGSIVFSLEPHDLKLPSKMAIGKHGNILVLGFASNNFSIISPKGNEIGYMLQGELNRPVAICLNNGLSKLYIADKIGKKLRCFDIFYDTNS